MAQLVLRWMTVDYNCAYVTVTTVLFPDILQTDINLRMLLPSSFPPIRSRTPKFQFQCLGERCEEHQLKSNLVHYVALKYEIWQPKKLFLFLF